MTHPAILCRGLTKVIAGRKVVDRVDLEVFPGEVFGFLGPNGAGKTTTIRLLLGLSEIDGGEAYLFSTRVPSGPDILSAVGSVVEQPSFYPWLSGRRNLAVLLQGKASNREITRALEQFDMEAAASSAVRTYSQGMRQRLGLALAFVRQPRLLILDEPATGLDPAGARDFRQLLRGTAEQGATVFLSSHQLSEVERACDRAAILTSGHVVAQGTVAELGGNETWIIVRVRPEQESKALGALSRMAPKRHGDGHILVQAESGEFVGRLLAEVGIFPESVAPHSSTLEERFLSVTEGQPDGQPDL